jgi:hypothetical protein
MSDDASYPDGRLYRCLNYPRWQRKVGFYIGETLKDAIAMIARMRSPTQGDAFAYAHSMASLGLLKSLLVSAAASGPSERYDGPSEFLVAYLAMCEAFAEAAQQRANGRHVFPLLSLAFANAVLNGQDTVEAAEHAQKLAERWGAKLLHERRERFERVHGGRPGELIYRLYREGAPIKQIAHMIVA